MGWGIDFKADIFLSRQDYQENINLVLDKIKELEDNIIRYKTTLTMYASCNIKDIVPKDWEEEPIDWIKNRLNDVFEQYEEDMQLHSKLYLYMEYLRDRDE